MGYRTKIGWITKDQYEALEQMPKIDCEIKIKIPQKTFFSGNFNYLCRKIFNNYASTKFAIFCR